MIPGSFKEIIKNALNRVKMAIIGVLLSISSLLTKILFSKVVLVFASATSSFIVGARLHEVGSLSGVFGKDLKNATVYISGPCSFSESQKVAALAEDEVKVTGFIEGKIIGVVRKTREVVECDLNKIAVDRLPILADFRKSPTQVPEIRRQESEIKIDPEWKKLAQQTLLMSGKCKSESGKEIPAFTDEVIDVTNVEQNKEAINSFVLLGIKKSDKIAVTCDSRYIKYSQYAPKQEIKEIKIEKEEKVSKSFLGETVLVTGTCFPDTRLPKHKQKQKVVFYPLVNARVQVTEEEIDEKTGKLKKFAGAALDAGVMLVCDQSRAALTYKEFDPESMKLSPIRKVGEQTQDDKKLDSEEDAVPSGINVSTEEEQKQ